jgi:hypothetical protein
MVLVSREVESFEKTESGGASKIRECERATLAMCRRCSESGLEEILLRSGD